MKKRIFAAILAAAMTFAAVPALLPAGNVSVSAAETEKLAAPKTLKVSAKTDTTVTLKWSKVSGADKYAVYRYDGDKKKYVKVKNVSKTTYTVTGLEPDTKYSFKVAALVKGADGTYAAQTKSKAKSVTTDEYPPFAAPKYGMKRKAALKSMGNGFMKTESRNGEEVYMKNVTYNGRDAVCMLMFYDDDTIRGVVLTYNGVSRKEYNAITAAYDEEYGAPYSEYGEGGASSKMWIAVGKENRGVMVVYDTESQSIMETFVYVYGEGKNPADAIAA